MTIHLPHFRARRTDPATSHDAADSIDAETVADSKDEVLFLLTSFGPMADHELVERHEREVYLNLYRHYSPQRLRTARRELVDAGRVEAGVGWTKTPSGRKAIIWRLVEEGK
jgi:hypothetical protein